MAHDDDDENFEARALCLRESDEALYVKIDGEKQARWVPKSVIHDDSEVFDSKENKQGKIVIQGWWARKEELL